MNDTSDISIDVLIEQKCTDTIKQMTETKTMINFEYRPYNFFKYTHKLVYQYSGPISIGALILFFLNVIVVQFVTNGNVLWIPYILIGFSLTTSIISFGIFRLKPQGFTIYERSYEESNDVKLFDLIPKKDVIDKEIEPYLMKARNDYINAKVKMITSLYLKEITTEQSYDIKQESLLTAKLLNNYGEEDDEEEEDND